MDYSICNALAYHTEPMNSALIIYDVACQWSINFHRHVQDSHFLNLPHITDLIPAVGKFHLAAYVPRCFARFSLNFVQGAGQLDGEILETLWSEFNNVSASACSMSKAHRAEVYYDHMRYSNWKKLVGMGKWFPLWHLWITISYMAILALTISKKFQKALEGLSQTRAAFQGLTDSLSEEKFKTGRGRRNRPRDTEGTLSRSMKSNKKRVLESFIGSYDLNADPPMQCHHRLTSD